MFDSFLLLLPSVVYNWLHYKAEFKLWRGRGGHITFIWQHLKSSSCRTAELGFCTKDSNELTRAARYRDLIKGRQNETNTSFPPAVFAASSADIEWTSGPIRSSRVSQVKHLIQLMSLISAKPACVMTDWVKSAELRLDKLNTRRLLSLSEATICRLVRFSEQIRSQSNNGVSFWIIIILYD